MSVSNKNIINIPFLLLIPLCLFAGSEGNGGGLKPEIISEIQQNLKQEVADDKIAGAVSLIGKDGKIAFLESYGFRDRENRIPMRSDTIFSIASLTKIIVNAAAMSLVDDGRLKLDDPVEKYIESFKNIKVLEKGGDKWIEVTPHNKMTVRHLMTHTAGLGYGFDTQNKVEQLYAEKGIFGNHETLKQMVDKLATVPLKYHPGEVWEYSFSIDVLAHVMEIAAEQPLDLILKNKIFVPLGMQDTDYWVPEEKRNRMAAIYKKGKDGKAELLISAEDHANKMEKPTYFSGGTGLYSTANDYYLFLQMLLSDGIANGVRILTAESIKEMMTNQLGDAEISKNTPWIGEHGFGLSLNMNTAADNKGIAYGWSGSTGTFAWFNKKHNLIGVYMSQFCDPEHTFAKKFSSLAQKAAK